MWRRLAKSFVVLHQTRALQPTNITPNEKLFGPIFTCHQRRCLSIGAVAEAECKVQKKRGRPRKNKQPTLNRIEPLIPVKLTGDTSFRFPEPLIQGVIRARPNRFIMHVEVDGLKELQICHCPSTGRIGGLRFDNIPCLLSKPKDTTKRSTAYTVEAISLDENVATDKITWIGINQHRSNRYVEHFLLSGALGDLVADGHLVRRERKLGSARIDFAINDNVFLEVKTLLIHLPSENHSSHDEAISSARFHPSNRLVKHLQALQESKTAASRAIILLCYCYDAPIFRTPTASNENSRFLLSQSISVTSQDNHLLQTSLIADAVARAEANGVEFWQVNLKLDNTFVVLQRLVKLNLGIINSQS